MIVKRLGAITLAVILILGAWIVRDRVIEDDGDGSGDDDPPRADREIVCCVRPARRLPWRSPKHVTISTFGSSRRHDARRARRARGSVGRTDLDHDGAVPVDGRQPSHRSDDPTSLVDARHRRLVADRARRLSPIASMHLPTAVERHVGLELCRRSRWTAVGGPQRLDVAETCRPAFAPIDSAIGLLGVADAVRATSARADRAQRHRAS